MAFQLSKLAARVSLSKHFGLIRETNFPRCLKVYNTIKNCWSGCSFHTLVRSGRGSLNTTSVLNSSQRFINTVRRVEKCSATSVAYKSFEWPSFRAWKRGGKFSRSTVVLFGLSAAVVASSIHSSALYAMAAQSELDLEGADWKKAKKELLSMSLEERRKKYRTYISLDEVPIWSHPGDASDETRYKANDELNKKISLFRGDITKLEIDAVANAANKTLLGGGGVDGAIHSGAGPLLRKECATLGGCETGEAKITGAYGLPAKYVIHTVGPIAHGSVGERERRALRDCYYNCLHTAAENKLRTVAFPCISTGVYGYPPEQAVEVALATVREFLEEHHAQMDRVIFCVFLRSDEELYKNKLPAYFPQDASPKSKL
ncbi:ADP-ribose glycohydrolase MACROD1 isoform X2 [Salminus brasiliensis]|uniref:ADP-ribose glycohydrolase MACROD1 isoform X2 n=1 Tax=Salminus brasiliensis TaxID=930266 RepID=UPI003B835448